MNSDLEGSLEAVRASLERLAQSGEEAVRNVGEPVQLDLSTGDATVDRVQTELMLATMSIPESQSRLDEVVSDLVMGFAVHPDRTSATPWAALLSLQSTSHLTLEGWSNLGIEPVRRPEEIRNALTQRFTRVPDQVLDIDNLGRLARGVSYAQLRDRSDSALQAQIARIGGGDDGGLTDPVPKSWPNSRGGSTAHTGAIATTGTTVPTTTLAAITFDNVRDAASCFINAEWGLTWWGMITICMDRQCADAIQNILTLGAGGTFVEAVGAFIKSGVSAAISSVGGWVGAALVTFAVYWSIWINARKNANGVCIYHRAPWAWWLPHFPPGYATGR